MLEKIKLAIGIALLALTPVMAADNWREYSQLMGDGGLVETTAVITHVKRHIGKGSRRRKYTVRYVFEDELRRSWTGEQRIWWSENLEPSKTIKISYRPSNPRANAIYPSALWTDVLISSILAILAMILLSGGFWAFIHERRRKQRYTRSARSNELLLEREPRRAPPPHDVSAQPDGGTAAEPSYAQWARGRKLQQQLQREQRRAPPPAVPPFRIRNVPSLRIRIPSLRTCKKEEH